MYIWYEIYFLNLKFMKKLSLRIIAVLCCIPFFFVSCKASDKTEVSEPKIKEIIEIGTIDVRLVKEGYSYFLKRINTPGPEIKNKLSVLKYNIKVCKVTYNAVDPFGIEKTLSGLVIYPVLPADEKDKKLNIISVQHGTLGLEEEAPSNYSINNTPEMSDVLNLIPSSHINGYITLVPDYFGYGADEKEIHYYEVRKMLAEASKKLIEAMPSFAEKTGLNIGSDKLLLFGYSEGGFATMSTLMAFSQDKESPFKNYITVAGAGAYDKPATALYVTQKEKGESINFIASYLWVMLVYNNVYSIDKKPEELVRKEIVPKIAIYEGTDKIMQIKDIPLAPSRVFNPDFVKSLVDGSEKAFLDALKDNDVSDFDAKGSVELVHGTNDTWVPAFNTDSTYARMKRRNVDVTKILFNGGTHSTTYSFFVAKAMEKL